MSTDPLATDPATDSATDSFEMVQVAIGHGYGLVTAHGVAVLDPDNHQLAERLWALLDADVGVDELLEAVSAVGLRSLRDLGLVVREGAAVRVVVRGAAVVHVDSAAGTTILTAHGTKTWSEVVIDEVSSFHVQLSESADRPTAFRVATGLVPAVALAWPAAAVVLEPGQNFSEIDRLPNVGLVATLQSSAPSDDSAPIDVSAPLAAPADEVAEAAEAKPVGMTDGASKDPTLAPAVEPTLPDPGDQSASLTRQPDELAAPEVVPVSTELEGTVGDEADNEYDDLFGHTKFRSVQNAAVVVGDSTVAGESGDVGTEAPGGPEAGHDQTRMFDDERSASPAPSGLIAGIPPSSAPPPAPAANLGGFAGDHDGHTVSRASLQARQAAPLGGPTVMAVTCASGHANPAHSTVCRLCGQATSDVPSVMARPILGRIRLSSGPVIELDRPVLMGRNPKVEGRIDQEMPRLVTIDVGQALSRTHVAIRLEGWQVLVEDLGSANGTTVTAPGRVPLRLRPSEPTPLEPGSVIDLGGEVSAVYDAGF